MTRFIATWLSDMDGNMSGTDECELASLTSFISFFVVVWWMLYMGLCCEYGVVDGKKKVRRCLLLHTCYRKMKKSLVWCEFV